jgi:uncharacterized protein YjbI with pentapeptide repeats
MDKHSDVLPEDALLKSITPDRKTKLVNQFRIIVGVFFVIVIFILPILVLFLIIWSGYLRFIRGFGWADWTGFAGKTLWQWMELLIIPSVLGIAATLYDKSQKDHEQRLADKRIKNEREISLDRFQEETFRDFTEKLSDLMLNKNLRISKPDDEVRFVARAHTLTTFRTLDIGRKAQLIRYLYEANLINGETPPISLSGVDLQEIRLDYLILKGINLKNVNLNRSHLNNCDFSSSNFEEAALDDVYGIDTKFINANLEKARINGNFSGAQFCNANLKNIVFANTRFYDTNFRDAILDNSTFVECFLESANFVRASLSMTHFIASRSLSSTVFTKSQTKQIPEVESGGANIIDKEEADILFPKTKAK